MLALLRTRRWLGFTAVVLFAIIAFGLLSAWQWSRAEVKRQQRHNVDLALSGDPVDVSVLASIPLEPGEWRPVTARGSYDDAATVLVRKRPLDANNGMWVMTPLHAESGVTVWTNRGWVRAAATAAGTPDVPSAPRGTVTVTGFAREYEATSVTSNEGLPERQVAAAAPATLPQVGADPGFYLVAQSTVPGEPSLTAIPLPTVDATQNVSYAVQWILFAIVAIAGWFYFLRREARDHGPGGQK